MSRGDLDKELERLRAATDSLAPDDGLTDAILGAVARPGARDPLADIAKATASIDAPEALTDAILARTAQAKTSAPVIPLDAGRRSAPQAASASTGTQAAPSLRAPRAPSWMEGVTRSGPIAVGLGFVAAAACFLFFVTSQGEVDATVVSSVDTVEVLE